MSKKIFAYVLLFSMFSLISEATLVRGSVPNQGEKRFTFVPDSTGTVLLHLIYDNNNSDLDLELGFTNDQGDIQLVAISDSTLRNFEQMEVGVQGQLEYNIFVISARGPSPFRLNFDGTFQTSGSAKSSKPLVLKEAPMDAKAQKFLNEYRNRQRELKKN